MTVSKVYVTILVRDIDLVLEESDVMQLIKEAFLKEYHEGRQWGSTIKEVVERNVDLDIQIYNTFFVAQDDNDVKMVARSAFADYAPHIDPTRHLDFILRHNMTIGDEDHEMILYLVLVDEQNTGSNTNQTTSYPRPVSSSKSSPMNQSRRLSIAKSLMKLTKDFLINLALFVAFNVYVWVFLTDPSSTEHIIALVLTLIMGLLLIYSTYQMYRDGISKIIMIFITFIVLVSLASIVIVRGFV